MAEKSRLQAEAKRQVARAEKEAEAKLKATREELEKKQKQLQVGRARGDEAERVGERRSGSG